MPTKDAEALVIRNSAMLEEVAHLYNSSIGPTICKEIDDLIKKWVDNREWEGEFNLWDDEELWFCPRIWRLDDDKSDNYLACYTIDFVKDGDRIDFEKSDNEFYMSAFLGVGTLQVGFRFYIDFTKLKEVRKGTWKKFSQEH